MRHENLSPFICIQNSNNSIPKHFNYSTFCRLHTCKSGSDFFLPSNYLFAAGTLEGPIVLFAESGKRFKPVCVMCSHVEMVTSIAECPSYDYFVSSSADGTVCVWSNVDCTCVSELRGILQCGETKLVANENDTVWAWTLGFYAVLIDLRAGEITKRFPVYGLTSFSCLLPNFCSLVDKQVIVCTEINCIYSFEKMRKIRGRLTSVRDRFYISKYGIIKVVGNTWCLVSPYKLEEITNTTIKEMKKNDVVSCVEWSNTSTVCFGTYSGDFYIYLLKPSLESKFEFIKIYSLSLSRTAFISFFSFFDNKIVFSPMKSIIECLTTNGNHIMTKLKKREKNIYHVYGMNSNKVLIGNDRTMIFEDLNDFKKRKTFEVESRITAISTRKINDKNYQIIIGCKNGNISFYSENNSTPYKTIIGLTCPIIGFAHLPEKLNERQLFIAIGKNGSFALIIHNDIYRYFANDEIPILQVFYKKELQYIVIRRLDNVYVTYELYQSNPIFISLCLSNDSELIWESTEFCFNKNENISANVVKYGLNQILFNIIDLSKFNNNNRNQLLNRIIEQLYGFKISKDEFKTVQKSYSLTTNKERINQRNLNTIDFLENEGFMYFALLGKNNKPIFFYKKYSINYNHSLLASQNVATIHYLSKVIMIGSVNEEKHPELLLFICKYLSSDELQKLVNSAYQECENLIGSINENTAKTLIKSIDLSTNKICDLFLLSIILIQYPQLLSNNLHQKLYLFLVSFEKYNNDLSNLSFLILLQSFPILSSIVGSDANIFYDLIKFSKFEKPPSLQSVFSFLAISEFNSYFSAVNSIITNTNSIDEIKRILSLTTKIAVSSPEFNSGIFTLKMINLIENKKSIISLVDKEFENQCKYLPYITKASKYIIIGMNNGILYVYIDFKFSFTIHLFNSAIAKVLIGPDSHYCSALSIEESKAKTFDLFSKHSIIEQIDLNPNEKTFDISWKDSKHCIYKPVCF